MDSSNHGISNGPRMTQPATRILFCAVATLTLLMQAFPAHAYIISTEQVLEAWSDRHLQHDIHDLTLHLSTERVTQGDTVEQRLYLKQPERMRLIDNNSEGNQSNVYIEREGTYARGVPPALKRGQGSAESLLAPLFFPNGKTSDEQARRFSQRLVKAGVRTNVISLSFFEDRPVYIIGAQPWETTKPQLWLDKDRLQPLRYIIVQRTPGTAPPNVVETRFVYAAPATGEADKKTKQEKSEKPEPLSVHDAIPTALETYVNDVLVQRATITKREINRRLPETLFDFPATR